jgi:hypothetical protein
MRQGKRRKAEAKGTMKAACVAAERDRQEVERLARAAGLTLRVSEVTCGRGRTTLHWMFDGRAGVGRVLDWWPGSGRWRGDGRSGAVGDAGQALAVATAIFGGRPLPAGAEVSPA